MDNRLELVNQWLPQALRQAGVAQEATAGQLRPASTDASFRRYFRWTVGDQSLIVMDAPPPQEDVRPFVRIAGLLQQAGVRVPAILAADLEQGLLLLQDMGSYTYLQQIQAGVDPQSLQRMFSSAIDSLLRWQQASRPGELPEYDDAVLLRELQLFPDWYLQRHLGVEMTATQQADWQALCRLLLDSINAEARVFVHRDYMPRNLMVAEGEPGVLDFQDALYGPLSYDVTSLFADAFFSFTAEQRREWLTLYWQRALQAGLPVPAELQVFLDRSRLMGVQRHLKVLGIFARIRHRDGKPQYLQDAPRFLGYLREACAEDPRLAPLARLLDSLEPCA